MSQGRRIRITWSGMSWGVDGRCLSINGRCLSVNGSCLSVMIQLERLTTPIVAKTLALRRCRGWDRLWRGVSLLRLGRLLVGSLPVLRLLLKAVPRSVGITVAAVEGKAIASVPTIAYIPSVSTITFTVPAVSTVTMATISAILAVSSKLPVSSILAVSAIASVVRISISTIVTRIEARPVIIISVVKELVGVLAVLLLAPALVVIMVVVLVMVVVMFINISLVVPVRLVVTETLTEAAKVTEPLVEAAEMSLAVVVGGVQRVSVVVMQGQERRKVIALEPVVVAQAIAVSITAIAVSITTIPIWSSKGRIMAERISLVIWPIISIGGPLGTSRGFIIHISLFSNFLFGFFSNHHF